MLRPIRDVRIRKKVHVSTNTAAATPHNCGKSNGIQAIATKRFGAFEQVKRRGSKKAAFELLNRGGTSNCELYANPQNMCRSFSSGFRRSPQLCDVEC